MGLDMYMRKEFYVKNWDHMDDANKHKISILQGGKERSDIPADKISEISCEVGYWRKANAIHNWFVKNVQDGLDECQETLVSREQLKRLLNICKTIDEKAVLKKGMIKNGYTSKNGEFVPNMQEGQLIDNPEEVCKYLPTTDGFFFGSTDYDEYYIQDIQLTIEILEEALQEDSGEGDFYYQSSW